MDLKSERSRESLEVGDDFVEARLVEAGEVDLVDGQHDMLDADQRDDRGVAACLRQQAFARVDQQDGEIGARSRCRHIARILLMAGRVGDDEGAPRRRDIAVGDVDRNALFALGLEPIDEKGEVDIVAVGAVAPRVAFEGREVIVVDEALFIEKPPDEGRFAIVDGAAGDQPQGRRRAGVRVLPRGRAGQRIGGNGLEHQKYPSRFFFSIEPDSS